MSRTLYNWVTFYRDLVSISLRGHKVLTWFLRWMFPFFSGVLIKLGVYHVTWRQSGVYLPPICPTSSYNDKRRHNGTIYISINCRGDSKAQTAVVLYSVTQCYEVLFVTCIREIYYTLVWFNLFCHFSYRQKFISYTRDSRNNIGSLFCIILEIVYRVIKLIFTDRIKVYMAGVSWVTETASEVNGHMSQSGLTRLLCELLGVGILFVLFFVILWIVPVVSKNYQRLSSVLSCLENKQHLRWTHNLVCSSWNIGISPSHPRDGS